jgi:competence protein ComEC
VAQARVELRLAAETIASWAPISKERAAAGLAGCGRLLLLGLEMVLISAVIQVGLALPMAELFHRISFTGLSANLLIVPLLNLVVPLGFLAIFSGWVWVANVAGFLLTIAARIAAWHARAEPAWRIPDPPLWLALAFVAALLIAAVMVHRRTARWPSLVLVLALFGLLLWQPFPGREPAGLLELTAIDVAQGDSLVLRFPQGKLMVVDGGGILQYGKVRKSNFDTGEDVVSPYLWSRGIRRIDILVATHAHEDHSGGLKSLLENFRPAELWTGSNPSEALLEKARRLGVRVIRQHLAPPFPYAGTTIQFLSPPEDYPALKPGNNDSLAFRITYGSRSYLLTGDMERPMESLLLSEGVDLYADVLKVGHHGSKTSTISPFLDAVAPTIAIISAGYENSFGHPHPDVIRRLEDRHTTILRTDYDGLVTVRTDGRNLMYNMMTWEDPSGARQNSTTPFGGSNTPFPAN